MRTELHTRLAVFALTILTATVCAADSQKPNVLLIVADDLGYGELTVQGFSKDIPTPNIDSIAKNGVRFTSGYVSGPYCSPTRAALLSGRYQQRFGHEFNPGRARNDGDKVGFDATQKTLGDRLKAAGYSTAWIGKSHLGNEPEFHPQKRGFDYFYGFLGGAHDFLDAKGEGRDPVQRNGTPIEKMDYLTEEISREAIAFIESQKEKPWFTYLAFNAVHAPLQSTEKYLNRFSGISDPKRRKFAAHLSALDDAVGSVLARVRELKQEENTLIFFISDNGGPTPSITSGNGPLRGFKAQTWEGGVRVPWFVQWKGRLPAGKVDDRPVIQLDILPTALAAAGVEVQQDWKLDGVNLLPYLADGRKESPHDALFWRFGQQIAIRQGDWKLVKGAGPGARLGTTDEPANTQGAQLFNLARDIGEQADIAVSEPEKVKALSAAWDQWNASNIPPKWLPSNRRRNARPAVTDTVAAPAKGPWKSGDAVPGRQAPVVAGHAFGVVAEIDSTMPAGVILAQGGRANGYSLFVHEEKLTFALRVNGKLTVLSATKPLESGTHRVGARLDSDGKLTLTTDDQVVAENKLDGILASQPAEGLTIGSDGRGAVGEYQAPHTFQGKVTNANVTIH
jgi:arylsulfatase A-like enzyme